MSVIVWNDPAIGIDWHISATPSPSGKDQQGVLLRNADIFTDL